EVLGVADVEMAAEIASALDGARGHVASLEPHALTEDAGALNPSPAVGGSGTPASPPGRAGAGGSSGDLEDSSAGEAEPPVGQASACAAQSMAVRIIPATSRPYPAVTVTATRAATSRMTAPYSTKFAPRSLPARRKGVIGGSIMVRGPQARTRHHIHHGWTMNP